jgi:hypothetical protein
MMRFIHLIIAGVTCLAFAVGAVAAVGASFAWLLKKLCAAVLIFAGTVLIGVAGTIAAVALMAVLLLAPVLFLLDRLPNQNQK